MSCEGNLLRGKHAGIDVLPAGDYRPFVRVSEGTRTPRPPGPQKTLSIQEVGSRKPNISGLGVEQLPAFCGVSR